MSEPSEEHRLWAIRRIEELILGYTKDGLTEREALSEIRKGIETDQGQTSLDAMVLQGCLIEWAKQKGLE